MPPIAQPSSEGKLDLSVDKLLPLNFPLLLMNWELRKPQNRLRFKPQAINSNQLKQVKRISGYALEPVSTGLSR
jgi:hypothetical protein